MRKYLAKLYQRPVKWLDKFDSPKAEGLKSILRLGVMIVVSWFITETLSQLDLVPINYTLKIWVFTFLIPVRTLFFVTLTAGQKYLDKWMFEMNKQHKRKGSNDISTGLIPL